LLARRELLGLPVVLRVALELERAGVDELALFGPSAESVCAELRGDSRLSLKIAAFDAATPVELVCFHDVLVAPESLRRLSAGEGLADGRGVTSIALGHGSPGGDPREVLTAARVIEPAVLRLDDDADRRAARRVLLDGLIKPSDGPVSRRLNRHVSRFITELVLPLGVTPNGMTVFVALTGLAGAYAATSPTYAMQLLGAVLYQFHSIIDGCDGEIARLTHRFGKHGALIDSLVDDTCNAAFFVGLSLGVARAASVSWPLVTGALTAVAYVGVIALQYGVVLRATGRGDKTKFWAPAAPGQFSLFGVFKALLRRDVFVLLILIAVSLHLAPAAVAVFPLSALGAFVASSLRLMQSRGAA
jgi:phosphatidylglycerophosphate synthase